MDAALLSAIEDAINRYIKNIENTTIDGVLRKHLEGGMTAQQSLDRYTRASPGAGVSFTLVKQEAVDFISVYKNDLIKRGGGYVWDAKQGKPVFVKWLDDQKIAVREGITSKVNEAVEKGWGSGKLAKNLESVWDETDVRNSRIARSELARAQWQGSHTRFKNSEIKFVRRLLGMNPCPICDAIATADVGYGPGIYRIDDVPEVPTHPNCWLEGTPYKPLGRIVAGLRARYSGPIVEFVFSDGAQISVTPNHMLLTPNGFCAAQFVNEGDDVINCSGVEGIVTRAPNDNDTPSTVEEIFDSLLVSGGGTTACVPTTSEYLHGDGGAVDSNIDVVFPDSLLRGARDSVDGEQINELLFNRGRGHGTFGSGTLTEILVRLARASDRIVGGNRTTSPFFRGRTSIIDKSLFAHRADGDFVVDKKCPNGISTDMTLAGNALHGFPGQIHLSKVNSITYRFLHGFVYDFQTTSSLSVGNGIVTSNCECDDMPVLEDEM